jgi:hypothetical protein
MKMKIKTVLFIIFQEATPAARAPNVPVVLTPTESSSHVLFSNRSEAEVLAVSRPVIFAMMPATGQ